MTGLSVQKSLAQTPVSSFDAVRRTILVGTLLAFASATFYGVNIPAARVSSQAGFPGADLIFWRALLLVPALLAAALMLGVRLRLPVHERAPMLRLALAASFTATFYLSALDHLPVPMTVVIFYTFPLIVMLVSSRIDGRRLSIGQIIVFCIAFAGLLLAVGPSIAGLSPYGVTLAVLGAITCAGMFILAGRVENSALCTTFWTQIAMVPVALAYTLTNGGPVGVSAFNLAPTAIFITMAAYAAGYFLQMMAAARISAGRASLIFLFEPVCAILLAWVLLGEIMTPMQIAGVLAILAALAVEAVLGLRVTEPPVLLSDAPSDVRH